MPPVNHQCACWTAPLDFPALVSGDVHVWAVIMDFGSELDSECWSLLSSNEVARAKRYLFARDRHRFVVAWATTREILGHYLGEEPSQLCFVRNEHGKPSVLNSNENGAIQFSLSHSGSFVLLAVSGGRRVGVDIEQIRPISSTGGISERYFTLQEQAGFQTAPATKRLQVFFDYWTRKEALLKAMGLGLSARLDLYDVSSSLVVTGGDSESAATAAVWSLISLSAWQDYAATLVLEQPHGNYYCWRWSDNKTRSSWTRVDGFGGD